MKFPWVKVQNFHNLELSKYQILKLAICPLNIHNFMFKWSIVFRQIENKSGKLNTTSALDKLLGQLGIYATWLSSIAYLQKQLRIFIFFKPCFFFCDYTSSYCMKSSGMCLHIYSLPSSAFLKYQTRKIYCT